MRQQPLTEQSTPFYFNEASEIFTAVVLSNRKYSPSIKKN
jgi:hypothetical protein